MDGKTLRDKLVGSKDERAVSPVIGVILMVAITVILAAVIATLVMDFGQSTESPINAQVQGDIQSDTITFEVVEEGSADGFILRGPGVDGTVALSSNTGTVSPGIDRTGTTLSPSVGSAISTENDATGFDADPWTDSGGQVNIVAVDGDQTEQAGSFEVPSSWPDV